MAENLASEVIQASTDFDGRERAPMRLAEAHVTLGVVAARQGDLDEAIWQGRRALSSQRRSLPSLLMASCDLTKVLSDGYPDEVGTREYLDKLHVLSEETNRPAGLILQSRAEISVCTATGQLWRSPRIVVN